MDRRQFIAGIGAAALAPALPVPAPAKVGIDFASGPDQTVYRMMWIQREGIREIHRVTGIPRYQMGRDTWQDQIDAGQSTILEKEARHTVDELRSIGENAHADRVQRLIRSRIAARTENQRIHKAVKMLPPEVAQRILRK